MPAVICLSRIGRLIRTGLIAATLGTLLLPTGARAADALAPSVPTQIEIPAIHVSAGVVPVGEDSSGRMGVPTNSSDVAWWSLGQQPGQPGGTVFDGHLDWYAPSGRGVVPAVFWDLGRLRLGDMITVQPDDLTYHVTSVRSIPYTTDLSDLFSPDGASILTLLTCAGTWDASAHTYDQRTVVIARLDWRWIWTKKIEESR